MLKILFEKGIDKMSTSDDLNINNLKQLSQLISNDSVKQQITPQQTIPKVTKKVTIQTPPISESSDIPSQTNSKSVKSPQIAQESTESLNISPNFEFMGYVVNKQTIYLLIVLLLIGVGIWYVSSNKENKKNSNKNNKNKNKNENEDDNDDDE